MCESKADLSHRNEAKLTYVIFLTAPVRIKLILSWGIIFFYFLQGKLVLKVHPGKYWPQKEPLIVSERIIWCEDRAGTYNDIYLLQIKLYWQVEYITYYLNLTFSLLDSISFRFMATVWSCGYRNSSLRKVYRRADFVAEPILIWKIYWFIIFKWNYADR